MEYGSLQSVLDRFNKEMENQEDIETGLIKGVHNGAGISLMRYSLGLAIKSAPGNVITVMPVPEDEAGLEQSLTQLGVKTDVHVEVEPAVGDWQDIGQVIPPDFNDTISLAEHITVASIGQNAEGKTFIALLRDREKTRNQQYRFILIRRSGTVVEPSSLKTNTFADKLRERFSFDMPYHHIARQWRRR